MDESTMLRGVARNLGPIVEAKESIHHFQSRIHKGWLKIGVEGNILFLLPIYSRYIIFVVTMKKTTILEKIQEKVIYSKTVQLIVFIFSQN